MVLRIYLYSSNIRYVEVHLEEEIVVRNTSLELNDSWET